MEAGLRPGNFMLKQTFTLVFEKCKENPADAGFVASIVLGFIFPLTGFIGSVVAFVYSIYAAFAKKSAWRWWPAGSFLVFIVANTTIAVIYGSVGIAATNLVTTVFVLACYHRLAVAGPWISIQK